MDLQNMFFKINLNRPRTEDWEISNRDEGDEGLEFRQSGQETSQACYDPWHCMAKLGL